MENYKKMLKHLDETQSDDIITNNDKNHAKALIIQLLTGARKNINIISGKLAIYADDTVLDALDSALSVGVNFKVLLDDAGDDLSNNKFLQKCLISDLCSVKTSRKKLPSHAITRDGKAIRFCSDAHNPENNSAIASFNNKEMVENADNTVFSNYYDKLENYRPA